MNGDHIFLSRPSLWVIETSKKGFVIFLPFQFPSNGNNQIQWQWPNLMVAIEPILFTIHQLQSHLLATESILVTMWWGQMKSTRASEFMWHFMKTFLFVFSSFPSFFFPLYSLVLLSPLFCLFSCFFCPQSLCYFLFFFWYVLTFYFFSFIPPFVFLLFFSYYPPASPPPFLFFSPFSFDFALCFFSLSSFVPTPLFSLFLHLALSFLLLLSLANIFPLFLLPFFPLFSIFSLVPLFLLSFHAFPPCLFGWSKKIWSLSHNGGVYEGN